MVYLAFFVGELFLLFLFSRALSQRLSQIFYRITKNMKATIWALAILFLPGTLMHEAAHFLMAMALFVKVGKLELIPKVEGEGKVKMGSVQIEQVDLLRSLIIGIAPLVLGISVLLISLSVNISSVLKAYIAFEIGNSMFSSSKDMEGGAKVLCVILVMALVCYFLGVKINLETLNSIFGSRQILIIKSGDLFLLIPLVVDTVLLLFLSFL